jgi:hypothetical protein
MSTVMVAFIRAIDTFLAERYPGAADCRRQIQFRSTPIEVVLRCFAGLQALVAVVNEVHLHGDAGSERSTLDQLLRCAVCRTERMNLHASGAFDTPRDETVR